MKARTALAGESAAEGKYDVRLGVGGGADPRPRAGKSGPSIFCLWVGHFCPTCDCPPGAQGLSALSLKGGGGGAEGAEADGGGGPSAPGGLRGAAQGSGLCLEGGCHYRCAAGLSWKRVDVGRCRAPAGVGLALWFRRSRKQQYRLSPPPPRTSAARGDVGTAEDKACGSP